MLYFISVKLKDAKVGHIVRNARNRRLYKMVGNLEGKTRIRPLEVFPNGLVVQKPTDTIVASDIEVHCIGKWDDDAPIIITGVKRQREPFVRELSRVQESLSQLESKTTVTNKGAHAMKIMAMRARIKVLERGLAPAPTTGAQAISIKTTSTTSTMVGTSIQLADGTIGKVTKFTDDICHVHTSVSGKLKLSANLLRPADMHFSTL